MLDTSNGLSKLKDDSCNCIWLGLHYTCHLPHMWTWDRERNGRLKENLPQLGSTKWIRQRWGVRWTKVAYYRTMYVANDLPHMWTWDRERNGTLKGNLPQLGSMKQIKHRWGVRWTKVIYYRTMYVVNEKTQPYNETEPTPVEGGVRYRRHLIGKCFTPAMS
jgi:hypothetical protein